MKRPTLLAVAATVVLALAGCAQPEPEPFGVPQAAPSSAAPPEQTPDEIELDGPRVELPGGLLLKQLGKVAELRRSDTADSWTVRVVLDKIEVDPTNCKPYSGPDDRAHRLVLHLRVETSERFDHIQGDDGPQFYRWSTIGPDDVTEGAASPQGTCRDAKALPFDLRPAAKYRGEVTLDVS